MVECTESSDFSISSLQGQLMVILKGVGVSNLQGTFMFETRREIQKL